LHVSSPTPYRWCTCARI